MSLDFDKKEWKPSDTSILVVDDDTDVLAATVRLVTKAGYTVYQASTGIECIECAQKYRPDIILLDVDLPDKTGFEVCKILKADSSLDRTRIIFVSGKFKESDIQAEGLDLGGDGYITRPFSNREFLARVEALVRLQRTERALDYQRTWLNTILRSMNEAVIATDSRGRISFFNPLAEMMTGWGIKNAVGRPASEIIRIDGIEIPGIEDDTPLSDVSAFLARKFADDHVLIRPDGERIPVRAEVAMMFDAAGDPEGLVVLVRNISRRKKAEDRIKQYAEHLEELVEERTGELKRAQELMVRQERLATMGRMAGGIGHELRQPLGVLTNAVFYLKSVLVDIPDQTREYFDIMEEEVKRAGAIVSDLVGFSSDPVPNPATFYIDSLIDGVIADNPSPEGIADTVKDIPRAKVMIDKGHFEHIFMNLLLNAYESMPDGGSVIIEGIEDNACIKISVIDSGVGISKGDLERVFDPLYTTKPKRIGLGLCVADRLIRANGGKLEILSEAGVGTTATVSVPGFLESDHD